MAKKRRAGGRRSGIRALSSEVPRVSVVVAVHNGERYLEAQLRSILNQTHSSLEVLVADDASTDGSGRIAESLAGEDPRIRILRRPKNLGLVLNFLTALADIRGRYAAFSDQDDVWNADKLERLVQKMEARASNRLVYSDLQVCDQDLNPTGRSFWRAAGVHPRRGRLFELAVLRNIVPGCAMLFSREVADRIAAVAADKSFFEHHASGPLTEALFMHDHLAFIAAAESGTIDFVTDRLVCYRQHSGNAVGAAGLPAPHKAKGIARLERQLIFLEKLGWGSRGGECRRLNRFLAAWSGRGGLGERLAVGDCYWKMRSDAWFDKLAGCLECLLPSAYRFLSQK